MKIDISKRAAPAKTEWEPVLNYVADLHGRSVHPAVDPFKHPWEEIGPGYCYAPAFGHWDIVHAILDILSLDPEHARHQIENNLVAQEDNGLVPGVIYFRDGKARWRAETGHPPVWPIAVQDYTEEHGQDILPSAYKALVRQISWFEQERKAVENGFFYIDIHTNTGESGIDEGVRFFEKQTESYACVDATSHVFAMYVCASRWGHALGEESSEYVAKAEGLKTFIQERLFVEETGFFHDFWGVRDPSLRRHSFEGIWPVVVGAATPDQARRVIRDNLMNPKKFFCEHPIATVAFDDPRFELRLWRGPAWNSMTYWAARGCMNYSAYDAAATLLERALDDCAAQFERTGTIWEYYHPQGGKPEDLQRKPDTEFNQPCSDYLGHNPLLAMARLYEQATAWQSS